MSSSQTSRIEIIDALRGVALAGIVICHMVENYIGAIAPISFSEAVNIGPADQIIDAFIGIFLRGKFIALFSFLFGLSFFIQMDNGAQKNISFGPRFLWRLLLLFIIGYLHSLLYRGDILTIYAMLGIFLIPFYKVNSKWVLGLAALLFLGLGRYLIFFFFGAEHLFMDVDPTDQETPRVLEYYNTLKEGSIWEVFKTNGYEGHLDKMNFQYGVFGRGYFTFAFFLIGLFVGKYRFFSRYKEEKSLINKILFGSVITFLVAIGITAAAFISLGPETTFDNWAAMIGLSGMDLANFSITSIYIMLFVILYRKIKPERWLRQFAPYGRMALTNYFLQSVLGTLLLYGWGFGYIGELRNIYTFLIALVLIAFQMWYSKLWLKHFYYGPLEWLWRSLTFFKRYAFRRK